MNDTSDSVLKDNFLMHIVSMNKIQTEFMTQYLEKKIGIETTNSFKLHSLFSTFHKNPHQQLLGLLDFQSTNMSKVYSLLRGRSSNYKIAIFNAVSNNGIEKDALNHGLRGVFYQNDSLEVFAKGVQVILNGDVWFSRKTLSQYFAQIMSQNLSSGGREDVLTLREKEILIMLSTGANNQEIADTFFISQNNIKNHIYKIYKKIGVRSRLEAITWAMKRMWL